jgi:hypothetical protein
VQTRSGSRRSAQPLRRILQREFVVFGKPEFENLAGISASLKPPDFDGIFSNLWRYLIYHATQRRATALR